MIFRFVLLFRLIIVGCIKDLGGLVVFLLVEQGGEDDDVMGRLPPACSLFGRGLALASCYVGAGRPFCSSGLILDPETTTHIPQDGKTPNQRRVVPYNTITCTIHTHTYIQGTDEDRVCALVAAVVCAIIIN